MNPILVHCDIQVDDISIFEGSIVRNTVTDNFVYWSTKWFWKFVVVVRGGISSILNDKVVYDLIDVVCSDSWLDYWVTEIQSLSGQHCNFSQFCYLLFALHFYLFLQFRLLLFLRDWCKEIVRFDNVLRDGSFLWDYTRSKGSGEFEAFVPFLLLFLSRNMNQLMDSPSFFETFLTAEVRGVKVHLLARGADHSCFFTAARSPTFILDAFHSWCISIYKSTL